VACFQGWAVRASIGITLALAAVTAPGALAADCAERYSLADLVASQEAAIEAAVDLDDAAYDIALSAQAARISCLTGPLRPAVAAQAHMLIALEASLAGDAAGEAVALEAAAASLSTYALPEALDYTSDHPFHKALEAARGRVAAAPPAPGTPLELTAWVEIDGVRLEEAPARRPMILQIRDEDGGVLSTHYLVVGDPLPPGIEPVSDDPQGDASLAGAPTPTSRPVALAVSAGVSGAAAAALYGVALSRKAAYTDPATPYGELDALGRQANAISYGAIGVGAAALGLGVVTVLKW